jgi:glycosyltransferase involved in cell wall biosynthesis
MRAVSVIVAAFSLERWNGLVRSLESVLAQRPAPLEVILVIDRAAVGLLARAPP